jgi:hypothetical protein
MNDPRGSEAGSFETAELFQLRMALESTYEQRLQDLQDMLNFNAEVEARNPGLRWAIEQLRIEDRAREQTAVPFPRVRTL